MKMPPNRPRAHRCGYGKRHFLRERGKGNTCPFRKGSTYMSCIFFMVVSQAVMISGCGGGSGGSAAVPTAGNHGAGEALASGVAVASDRETFADAIVDYVSPGAWLSAPDGGAFDLGDFASGSVPFFLVEDPEFNLGALLPGGTPFDLGGKPDRIEGSATYEGGALGAHTRAGEVRYFDARIGFEADSDDNCTIEGVLSGITVQGDEMPDGRMIVMECRFWRRGEPLSRDDRGRGIRESILGSLER